MSRPSMFVSLCLSGLRAIRPLTIAAALAFGTPSAAAPVAATSWGYPFTVEARLAADPADPSTQPSQPLTNSNPTPETSARLFGAVVSATPRQVSALRELADCFGKPYRDTAAACTTSDCLADLIVGPGRGSKLMRLIADYGYHPGKGPNFSVAQLDALLDSFAGLPPAFLDSVTGRNRTIALEDDLGRFASSVRRLGPVEALVAISGPGSIGIRLGPIWRASTPQAQRLAVLHELAHDYSRRIGARSRWRIKWAEAAFRDDMRALRLRLPAGRISRYAATDDDEDFAETVVAYRYAPATLAAVAPNRFVFIRDEVFKS